jgi:hypothetical protein
MSSKRDLFTTYALVLVGNDDANKIIGIGTIRIIMHDIIMRTLTNVQHIPDMKNNLIFLGILDCLGC